MGPHDGVQRSVEAFHKVAHNVDVQHSSASGTKRVLSPGESTVDTVSSRKKKRQAFTESGATAGPAGKCESRTAAEEGAAGARQRKQSEASAAAETVHVWTDGACSHNGRDACSRAGIGVFFGPSDSRNVSEPFCAPAGSDLRNTNQAAELAAIERALNICKADQSVRHIVIHTDSVYCMNSLTKWIHCWKKNGWMNSKKQPVKNQSLIKRIDALLTSPSFPTVECKYVAAHAGNYENEQADALAVAGATRSCTNHT